MPVKIAADLHIHSALSPCGSLEMSPAAIVNRALQIGLDAIAITDHNSVENGFTAAAVGERLGLKVFCGMEAQTEEEVHSLCLFDRRDQAERFYEEIYPLLPPVKNQPDYFGDQVVVDEEDNVVRFEEKLLINSLQLTLPDLLERVRRHDGSLIPAHVESPKYGLLVNLGFVPAELDRALLELSYAVPFAQVLAQYPDFRRRRLIVNSDAHYLSDIGRACTIFEADIASLAALIAAGQEGRYRIGRRDGSGTLRIGE